MSPVYAFSLFRLVRALLHLNCSCSEHLRQITHRNAPELGEEGRVKVKTSSVDWEAHISQLQNKELNLEMCFFFPAQTFYSSINE